MSKTPQSELENQKDSNDSNVNRTDTQNSNDESHLNTNENSPEVLQKQVEFNYLNFDRRRSYEWKLSLALWTALSVFTALNLRGEVHVEIINRVTIIVIGITLSALIVALHLYFLSMVLGANSLDKKKSWYYEKALNIIMHTDWETLTDERSECLKKRIDDLKTSFLRLKGYWSLIVQVGITIILLLLAWYVLYQKRESKQIPSTNYRVSLSFEKNN